MLPQQSPDNIQILSEDDWVQARLGKATASRFSDILATLKKGGWGASRAAYAAELILERLTGKDQPSFQSAAMREGTRKEPAALATYALEHGAVIAAPEGHHLWAQHPIHGSIGASPDALSNQHGLVEVKCPLPHTHLEYYDGADPGREYRLQAQGQMWCTGRHWVDWCSFNPDFPEKMQLVRRRIDRDDAVIRDLETEIPIFLSKIAERVALYKGEIKSVDVLMSQLRASVAQASPGPRLVSSGTATIVDLREPFRRPT